MSKSVNIDIFDSSSIENAIEELEQLKKEVEEGTTNTIKDLTQLGVRMIAENFASAQYSGSKDISVDAKVHKKTSTIEASGKPVLFIEFGTGITNPDSPEARAELTSGQPCGHGEYGLGKGSNPQGWSYYSEERQRFYHTKGNPAQIPVYRAKKELVNQLEESAERSFKK